MRSHPMDETVPVPPEVKDQKVVTTIQSAKLSRATLRRRRQDFVGDYEEVARRNQGFLDRVQGQKKGVPGIFLFLGCLVWDKVFLAAEKTTHTGIMEVVVPFTWLSGCFGYVLLPFNSLYNIGKKYDNWELKNYADQLIPDLSESSSWVELSIYMFPTTEFFDTQCSCLAALKKFRFDETRNKDGYNRQALLQKDYVLESDSEEIQEEIRRAKEDLANKPALKNKAPKVGGGKRPMDVEPDDITPEEDQIMEELGSSDLETVQSSSPSRSCACAEAEVAPRLQALELQLKKQGEMFQKLLDIFGNGGLPSSISSCSSSGSSGSTPAGSDGLLLTLKTDVAIIKNALIPPTEVKTVANRRVVSLHGFVLPLATMDELIKLEEELMDPAKLHQFARKLHHNSAGINCKSIPRAILESLLGRGILVADLVWGNANILSRNELRAMPNTRLLIATAIRLTLPGNWKVALDVEFSKWRENVVRSGEPHERNMRWKLKGKDEIIPGFPPVIYAAGGSERKKMQLSQRQLRLNEDGSAEVITLDTPDTFEVVGEGHSSANTMPTPPPADTPDQHPDLGLESEAAGGAGGSQTELYSQRTLSIEDY